MESLINNTGWAIDPSSGYPIWYFSCQFSKIGFISGSIYQNILNYGVIYFKTGCQISKQDHVFPMVG